MKYFHTRATDLVENPDTDGIDDLLEGIEAYEIDAECDFVCFGPPDTDGVITLIFRDK